MLGQFGTLKDIVRVRYYSIDNFVFKLHYRITFYILLVATILVTSRQYIGEHIRCLTDGIPEHVINTFCFLMTTFTAPKHYNATLLHKGAIAHPGVGSMGTNPENEEIRRHAYYQWVPFVLFGQAIMFYLPHLFWKSLEGGKLKRLADGLHNGITSELDDKNCHVMSKTVRDNRLQDIQEVLSNKDVLKNSWSYYLMFCEHLNFLNVILQAFLINAFLGGQFFNLGTEAMEHGLVDDITVLEKVFPKVTKCTFHKYGPSGTIQSHDAMCVMALNIINEKIYVCLWFWLLFLLFCSGLALLYRYLSLLLHARSKLFNELVFLFWRPAKMNAKLYFQVVKRFDYTEWLFLGYLSQNMDAVTFRELFTMLAGDGNLKKPLRESKEELMLMTKEQEAEKD